MKRYIKIFLWIFIPLYLMFLAFMWITIGNRRHNSKRYYIKIEEFKNQNVDKNNIIFVGNSITEGYDLDKFYNAGYINRGIAGDMTSGVLERLDEIISRQPRQIVLLIGINDISRGIPNEIILENYKKILEKIKNELPHTKVLTLSVLPVRNTFCFRRFLVNSAYFLSFVRPYNINTKVKQLNKSIENLTKNYGYQYLNIYDKFTNGKDNYLKDEYAIDYVHLSDKGYALMTRLVKPYLLD